MVVCSTYSCIITLTNKISDHNMLYDTFLAKTWRSNDSKSASSYALKPANVIILMNKVKGLKDSLGVSERCQDYHQEENLMARTETSNLLLHHLSGIWLESANSNSFPSALTIISTNLKSIGCGARNIQYKCYNNPHNTHPLTLNVPAIFVYSMYNWVHGENSQAAESRRAYGT
jgi:hypothetical protein